MYIYFDKHGVLREVLNNEDLRLGNDKHNEFYFAMPYDMGYNRVWFLLEKPNGELTNEIDVTDQLEKGCLPNFDRKSIFKYFEHGKEYQFLKYTFSSDEIDQKGLYKATIRVVSEDGNDIQSLGLITFNVEDNVIKEDNYITQSEFDYIIEFVSKNISKREKDIDELKKKVIDLYSNIDWLKKQDEDFQNRFLENEAFIEKEAKFSRAKAFLSEMSEDRAYYTTTSLKINKNDIDNIEAINEENRFDESTDLTIMSHINGRPILQNITKNTKDKQVFLDYKNQNEVYKNSTVTYKSYLNRLGTNLYYSDINFYRDYNPDKTLIENLRNVQIVSSDPNMLRVDDESDIVYNATRNGSNERSGYFHSLPNKHWIYLERLTHMANEGAYDHALLASKTGFRYFSDLEKEEGVIIADETPNLVLTDIDNNDTSISFNVNSKDVNNLSYEKDYYWSKRKTSIQFKTINGRPIIGTGDITLDFRASGVIQDIEVNNGIASITFDNDAETGIVLNLTSYKGLAKLVYDKYNKQGVITNVNTENIKEGYATFRYDNTLNYTYTINDVVDKLNDALSYVDDVANKKLNITDFELFKQSNTTQINNVIYDLTKLKTDTETAISALEANLNLNLEPRVNVLEAKQITTENNIDDIKQKHNDLLTNFEAFKEDTNNYIYWCTGEDDNIKLSEMVQNLVEWLETRGNIQGHYTITINDKKAPFGFSRAIDSGKGYDYFILGTHPDRTPSSEIVLDFGQCGHMRIDSIIADDRNFNIFGGENMYIKNCTISANNIRNPHVKLKVNNGYYQRFINCVFYITSYGDAPIVNGFFYECSLFATVSNRNHYSGYMIGIDNGKFLHMENCEIHMSNVHSGGNIIWVDDNVNACGQIINCYFPNINRDNHSTMNNAIQLNIPSGQSTRYLVANCVTTKNISANNNPVYGTVQKSISLRYQAYLDGSTETIEK